MVALPKQHNILDFPAPIEMQDQANEWYTKSEYIEAARTVMGGIDLDPASCEMANRTVKAARYYTKEENGLTKPWLADRVFLNPPYSLATNKGAGGLFISSIENFSTKLIAEYELGNVKQAIMLVLAKVDSQWFQALWQYPICFADHAVKFIGVKSNPKNSLKHMFGTVFVYLGPNEQAFIETFSQFGRIARAIDTPKPSPVNLTLWDGGDA